MEISEHKMEICEIIYYPIIILSCLYGRTARDSIVQPSVCRLIICISNVLQNVYKKNWACKMLA